MLANALSAHARAPVTRASARRWTKTVSATFPAVDENALLSLLTRRARPCAVLLLDLPACECEATASVSITDRVSSGGRDQSTSCKESGEAMSAKKQKTAKTRCAIVTTTIYVRDLGRTSAAAAPCQRDTAPHLRGCGAVSACAAWGAAAS